ncbi:hypothetical protein V6N12_007432 [Hibiscus sabdariffa]|uniref:Uncharacterized protein n=1 Tax=Hibiscus sabdariffa TaxID=183260 RepID=A0ABR2F1T4_9ROSI
MEGVVVFDACAANGVVASSFSNSSRDAMNIISTVKGTAVLSKDWKELFSSQTLSFYPYGKKDGKVYSTAPRDTGGADDCVGEIIVTGPTEIETCSGEVVLEIIGEVFGTILASDGLETGPGNSNHALPIGEEFMCSSNKFEVLCSIVEV